MPGKLSITVGLPGSGKTTLAKKIREIAPSSTVLVSRDDLRAMLFDGEGILTGAQEAEVSTYQKDIVKRGLRADKHVVVHDLNLREKYRTAWAKLAWNQGANFDIVDLTQVPAAECVARDNQRMRDGKRHVGGALIMNLNKKFIMPLKGQPVSNPYQDAGFYPTVYRPYVPDLSKPKAIIVDIDGTVAKCEGVRSPYDYTKVSLDKPNEKVIRLVQSAAYDLNYKILFVSGRLGPYGSQCYKDTEEWLYLNVKVPIEDLHMRWVDGVDDTVIKAQIFDVNIYDNYNVQWVLDDRDRVVDMWRQRGLLTLQVERGDF